MNHEWPLKSRKVYSGNDRLRRKDRFNDQPLFASSPAWVNIFKSFKHFGHAFQLNLNFSFAKENFVSRNAQDSKSFRKIFFIEKQERERKNVNNDSTCIYDQKFRVLVSCHNSDSLVVFFSSLSHQLARHGGAVGVMNWRRRNLFTRTGLNWKPKALRHDKSAPIDWTLICLRSLSESGFWVFRCSVEILIASGWKLKAISLYSLELFLTASNEYKRLEPTL